VGLTEAAIYHHFQSKRAIVEALYEQRGFMKAMEELEHLSGTMPLEQQLVANGLASAQLWNDNADLLRVVIVEVLGGDKAAKIVHRGFVERWRKGILDLLSRYRTRGEIVGDADVVEAADRWVNLMFGIFMDRLLVLGRSARRAGFLTPEFREYVEVTARLFGRRLREEPATRLDSRR
jgi:AcrR family transcriptional regulator